MKKLIAASIFSAVLMGGNAENFDSKGNKIETATIQRNGAYWSMETFISVSAAILIGGTLLTMFGHWLEMHGKNITGG